MMNKETTHELKTWKPYFGRVFMGAKTFEVRKADRNFGEGDIMIRQEDDTILEKYTVNVMALLITYK